MTYVYIVLGKKSNICEQKFELLPGVTKQLLQIRCECLTIVMRERERERKKGGGEIQVSAVI